MDEKKKSIDDLLSDLGVLEEAPVEVGLKESGKEARAQSPKEVLEAFLVGLLLRLDPAHYVEVRQEGNLLKAEVKGGDLGRFIGKEGRTLKAVEYLAGVVLAKHFGGVTGWSWTPPGTAGARRRRSAGWPRRRPSRWLSLIHI